MFSLLELYVCFLCKQMSAQRRGPVAEKLQSKEEAKRELCQVHEEAEAVSKAELDSLKASVDAVSSSTQQITR